MSFPVYAKGRLRTIRKSAKQLVELQQRTSDYTRRDGRLAEDEFFYAEQNARLPEQFDAVLHFDETRAVEPLDRTEQWETGEPPETYPTSV